jgi:hypothetical protein
MIRCHREHLEARCRSRGYTLDEVMPCVVSQEGDYWTIDTDHPAYPAVARVGHKLSADCAKKTLGVGSHLKRLLARIGITASPECFCNVRAAEMDANGVDWCEQHLSTIVGWLREEAAKRGLPFLDAAGRLLVRRAIRNARRSAS